MQVMHNFSMQVGHAWPGLALPDSMPAKELRQQGDPHSCRLKTLREIDTIDAHLVLFRSCTQQQRRGYTRSPFIIHCAPINSRPSRFIGAHQSRVMHRNEVVREDVTMQAGVADAPMPYNRQHIKHMTKTCMHAVKAIAYSSLCPAG
jgi:hypothetical protein